jgi:2-polyprenyl-3-methyl-5-hydroxy-6-metoxy-1,4-benzoquinol methylase
MHDRDERRHKADKVLAVLRDYWGDTRALSLLDVSCSAGHMTASFAEHFATVHGIDIDRNAVESARRTQPADNLQFQVMDALHTEYPDDRFDVVVCNQMYEHVPDAQMLLDEIYRILRPGGVCYFSATNRLKVIETHYGRIPFLSYLPKPLAHRYLRALGKGEHYYETFYTYRGLRKLCRRFERIDYTLSILSDPARYHALELIKPHSLLQRLALLIARHAYWLVPGYIWLLRKPA